MCVEGLLIPSRPAARTVMPPAMWYSSTARDGNALQARHALHARPSDDTSTHAGTARSSHPTTPRPTGM
eukprot:366029-Chlamydomonas_euryale.AAC.47